MRPGENYFGFGFCAAFSELAEGIFEKVVGRDGRLAEIFSHSENKFGAHIIYQNGLYLSSPEKQMVTKQVF